MATKHRPSVPARHVDDRPGGELLLHQDGLKHAKFDTILERGGWKEDGWASKLTGLGTRERDKRLSSRFSGQRMTWDEAEELYRGDDMAARVVDTIPEEEFREGFEVQMDSASMADDVAGDWDDLMLGAQTQEAQSWGRAYGGSGQLLGVDDGQRDLTKPLNEDKIKTFAWVTNLAPRELMPLTWYADPTAARFGEPEIYAVMPLFAPGPSSRGRGLAYLEVHESRILRWEGGVRVSRKQLYENYGWPDSVLNRCNGVIRDFQQSWASAQLLIQDFSQAVMSMEGLAAILSKEGDKTFERRIAAQDAARSVLRMMVIDSKDKFERTTTPMSGLGDVLELMCLRICATAHMPATIMFGQSPKGFSTGDAELQWFYDTIAADQNRRLKRGIKRMLWLRMKAKDGPTKGRVPKKWDIVFRNLWRPTAKDAATIRLNTSQADTADIQAGVLTPEEVAKSRFGGPRYSTETTIDLEAREAMAASDDPEKNAALQQPEGGNMPITPPPVDGTKPFQGVTQVLPGMPPNAPVPDIAQRGVKPANPMLKQPFPKTDGKRKKRKKSNR